MSMNLAGLVTAFEKPTTLYPFVAKDVVDNTGRTVMAYKESGKHEARERFIEEGGTGLFWIGGIPAVRWLANKFIAPLVKVDPDIHISRVLLPKESAQAYKGQKLVELTEKYVKNKVSPEAASKVCQNAGDLAKNYKRYHFGVTFAAIAINFFMLTVALPRFNQGLSKKIIVDGADKSNNNIQKDKNINVKKAGITATSAIAAQTAISNTGNGVFSKVQKSPANQNNIKFTGLGGFFNVKEAFDIMSIAKASQVNPTNSMLLLDYGIAGSRTFVNPRNNDERVENAVKEGGIILFFYQAASWIEKGLKSLSKKAFKAPIALDYKAIANEDYKKALKSIKAMEDSDVKNAKINKLHSFVDISKYRDELKALEKAKLSKKLKNEKIDKINVQLEKDVIKFIDDNLNKVDKNGEFDNLTLKLAQKTKLIALEKTTDGGLKRNSKKFIDIDAVIDLHDGIKEFTTAALEHGSPVEEFLTKAKKVKGAAVFGNMAICSVTLCYLLPKLQYLIREKRTGSKSYPGVRGYEEMAKKKGINA